MMFPRETHRDLFRELPEIIAWLIGIFMLINVLGGVYFIKTDFLRGLALVIAVLLGFVLHELGHRGVSKRLGCYARFSVDAFSVLLTSFIAVIQNISLILTSNGLPFIIALPGFVLSYCYTYERNYEGLISLAGPSVNILISIISLIISELIPQTKYFLHVVAYVNSVLALFNLLPIPPLDGYKVIRWNIFVWIISIIITLIVMILISSS